MGKQSSDVIKAEVVQDPIQQCASKLTALLDEYNAELRVVPNVVIVIDGQTFVPQIQLRPKASVNNI